MRALIPNRNERFNYRVSFNHLHAGDLSGEIEVSGNSIVVRCLLGTTKFVSKIYTLSSSIESTYSLDDGSFLKSTVEINEKGRKKSKEIFHDKGRGVMVENGIEYISPGGTVCDMAGLVVSVRDASILGKTTTLYEGKRFFTVDFARGEESSFFKRLRAESSALLIRPVIHGLDRGHVDFHIDHNRGAMPYKIEVGMKFAAFTLDLVSHETIV